MPRGFCGSSSSISIYKDSLADVKMFDVRRLLQKREWKANDRGTEKVHVDEEKKKVRGGGVRGRGVMVGKRPVVRHPFSTHSVC